VLFGKLETEILVVACLCRSEKHLFIFFFFFSVTLKPPREQQHCVCVCVCVCGRQERTEAIEKTHGGGATEEQEQVSSEQNARSRLQHCEQTK